MGFEELQNLSPYMQNKISFEQNNENEVFQLSFKGLVQKKVESSFEKYKFKK